MHINIKGMSGMELGGNKQGKMGVLSMLVLIEIFFRFFFCDY